mmetsp:Transcript_20097/g.56494  ORF Transcript_20097/g.56494 Transcript_20097/m.56494 type:complete len:278 (+) Transcript_20097:279-1112(+)
MSGSSRFGTWTGAAFWRGAAQQRSGLAAGSTWSAPRSRTSARRSSTSVSWWRRSARVWRSRICPRCTSTPCVRPRRTATASAAPPTTSRRPRNVSKTSTGLTTALAAAPSSTARTIRVHATTRRIAPTSTPASPAAAVPVTKATVSASARTRKTTPCVAARMLTSARRGGAGRFAAMSRTPWSVRTSPPAPRTPTVTAASVTRRTGCSTSTATARRVSLRAGTTTPLAVVPTPAASWWTTSLPAPVLRDILTLRVSVWMWTNALRAHLSAIWSRRTV